MRFADKVPPIAAAGAEFTARQPIGRCGRDDHLLLSRVDSRWP
jgi:hypothetical protein